MCSLWLSQEHFGDGTTVAAWVGCFQHSVGKSPCSPSHVHAHTHTHTHTHAQSEDYVGFDFEGGKEEVALYGYLSISSCLMCLGV